MVERLKKDLPLEQPRKSILNFVYSKSCLPHVTTGELCGARLPTVTTLLRAVFRSRGHFDRDELNDQERLVPAADWTAFGGIVNASVIPPHLQGSLKTKLYSTSLTVGPESYLNKIFSVVT